jgi:hypothetical protein
MVAASRCRDIDVDGGESLSTGADPRPDGRWRDILLHIAIGRLL